MENVLLDIAIEVAKYLSPRDISSCCAVSRHWREVFGTNEVWKGLCDSELEEHLRTTPCVVEPQFSLPEQHCSLAPLSQWRAAYLREQHLWKNWGIGNCKTVEHKMDKDKNYPELFVTNNLIMAFYLDSIELWDLKTNPPTKKDLLLFGQICYYTPRALNNGIFVLKGYSSRGGFVKIVEVDVAQGTINYKWQVEFNLDYSCKLVTSNTYLFNDLGLMENIDLIITPGGKCISYFWFCKENYSFYVWDLKNGVELRKECCSTSSLPEGGLSIVGCKTGSKTCEDILVLLPNTMSPDPPGIVSVTCQVYNVHQLCFLPFKQIFPVFWGFLMDCKQDSFDYSAITDHFLALSDCDIKNPEEVSNVRVYNYRSGHIIHILPSRGTIHIINDSRFMFKMPKAFKQLTRQRPNSRQMMPQDDKTVLCSVFCPSGAILEDTTGSDVNHFRVVGKGLVQIISSQVMLNFLGSSSTQVWMLNQFSSFKTGVVLPGSTHVNRAFTKVITSNDPIWEEEDTIRVTYFW
ncbi:uncharacterized protein LOC128999666 [Macrosteles quadrilineatus]|uniref:uncharacterized protein LOC128999666 n=1 Tax=Macrosteles quadrilineatus TaxID=74068 RepID=UPI0023E30239|nr:uncharacterized protein LOC128999666 [Macrosteles quadrilineatus]